MWPDFTVVTLRYWTAELMQTFTLLYSDAFFNSCFHSAVSFCCVYIIIEWKARSIYLHIHPNAAQQLQVYLAGFEELNYIFALESHWSTPIIAGC